MAAYSLNLGKFNRVPFVNPDGTFSQAADREIATVQRLLGGALGVIYAETIGFTPGGSVAAGNVQEAIEELDAEKQPRDATLDALAATPTAADKLTYWSGVDAASQTDFTAFARSLLAGADAAAMRATLGAGTGSGDVVGPAAATADALVVFDGTTGKLVKDGGTTLAALTANIDQPRFYRRFLLMGA